MEECLTMREGDTNKPVQFVELAAANEKKIGHARLNSPATLNALITEMVELMLAKLQQWASDAQLACVVISGAGDKAFCAGGDVQALRDSAMANPGGPCIEAETFFAREYRLDYTIHTYNKPILVWGSGIVMGGGLGILAGASHRLVTESSRFAMPEVTIGLYPDVGGSYFLNLMPGSTGRFLALTGASFNAADALYCGIADWFLPSDHFPVLLETLQAHAPTNNQQLASLLQTMAGAAAGTMPTGNVASHREIIDKLCSEKNIATVLQNMASLHTDDPWLVQAQKNLTHGSPLSILLIDAQLARSVGKPLVEVFRAEWVLSTNIVRYPEFSEGVRALLVDKDRQPQWQFADIHSVPANMPESFFIAPPQDNPLADL